MSLNRIRSLTSKLMRCRTCGGEMLIGHAGLLCGNGCGGLVQPWLGKYFHELTDLRLAWPERVIESKSVAEITKHWSEPKGDTA